MIRRVEALNFRGLRYVSQELRSFQVLVGPNASGKSTFLDVPAMLSDFVRYGMDEALLFGGNAERGRARDVNELIFNQSADHFELALEFTVPDHLRQERRLEKQSFRNDLARYEVSFGKSAAGSMEIRAESLWLIDEERVANDRRSRRIADADESQPALFPMEPVPPDTLTTPIRTPSGWRTVVRKVVDSGIAYFKSEGGGWNFQFGIEARKAALAVLPEDVERFPVAIWVRNQLRDSVRVLALNSAAMRRPVSPTASRRFSVEGANLPLVIQNLEKNHEAAYADWLAHLRTILPDLHCINIHERPEDRHLYLSLQYRTAPEPVPSWLVSDGTLRLMALTLLAYLPDDPGIYLIEEPENGIHPRAVEGVFQSLSSVYAGQVLVASHSPLFLGLAEPKDLLCFAKNPSGAVDIVSGDDHPALRNWKGQIDLSTLYAAGVLG